MSTNPIATAPTWTTPTGGAWSYRYDGTSARTAPIVTPDNHVVLSATKDFNNLGKHAGEIVCVDYVSLDVLWVNIDAAGVQGTPCLANGILYAGCNTGTLWAIAAADGVTQWHFAADANIVTAPVFDQTGDAGLLFFATTNGVFYALNVDTHAPQWTPFRTKASGQGESIVTAAAVVGELVIFAASTSKSGAIYALHSADGTQAWSLDVPAPVRSDPAVHDQLVFFGCEDGRLLAVDAATGRIEWTESTSRAIVGAPACDDNYVYYGSLDGTFNARALRDGVEPAKWFVQVSTSLTTDIAVHEETAYFGGQSGAGQSALFLLDLASAEAQSAKVLVDALQAQVNVNRAIQRGHVTFLDTGPLGGTAFAVDVELASYIDRVSFSSQLIPDDYVADPVTGEPMPAAAVFQMTVQIVDENRSPMPYAAVKVWAAQEIDGGITWNQTRYDDVPLTELNALSLQADANGQLALTAAGGVGMSALFFRPEFFLPGLSLHVFPDQANLDKLSAVTGDDLSPTPSQSAAGEPKPAATSYDGKPIIKDSYYGSLEDIATSMRNTIGRQQNASNQKLRKSTAATDAQRQLTSGEVAEWTVEIRPDAYTFEHGVSDTFTSLFTEEASPGAQSVWGDFEDFVKEVVDGTEKVAKTEWKYTEDAAQVVVQCATKAYRFVVKTVEDAVDVLIAIVKEVVTQIEKFIEWLSWLFSWQDIVKVQKKIIDRVNDRLEKLEDWLTADAAAEVKRELELLKGDIEAAFGATVTSTSGKTVGSVQNATGSSSDLLHVGGHDYTIQTGWLPKKLAAHIDLGLIPGGAVDDLAALTAAYLDQARQIVTSEFSELLIEIEEAAQSFAKLFTSPGGFQSQALPTMLEIFGDLLVLGIDCAEALIDITFEFFASALALVRKTINEPYTVPVLSGLYELLTGSKLTSLSFTALVIAVPSTLVAKAGITLDSITTKSSAKASVPDWLITAMNCASAMSYLPLATVWTVESSLEEGKELAKGWQFFLAAGSLVMNSLSLTAAVAVDVKQWQNWVFYLTQVAQSIPIFVGAAKHSSSDWGEISTNLWGIVGIVCVAESVAWAHYWPAEYFEPDSLNLMNNLYGSIPMFSPWVGKAAGTEYAVLDCVVGYGVSAGVTMYLAWKGVG